jgi:hypothetical protein
MVERVAYSFLTKTGDAVVNPLRDYPFISPWSRPWSTPEMKLESEVKPQLDGFNSCAYTELTKY